MLTHKPAGTGHPFAIEIDQRVPVVPIEGTPIRLGVSVVGETEWVKLQYRVNSGPTISLELVPSVVSSGSVNSSGGHLS